MPLNEAGLTRLQNSSSIRVGCEGVRCGRVSLCSASFPSEKEKIDEAISVLLASPRYASRHIADGRSAKGPAHSDVHNALHLHRGRQPRIPVRWANFRHAQQSLRRVLGRGGRRSKRWRVRAISSLVKLDTGDPLCVSRREWWTTAARQSD